MILGVYWYFAFPEGLYAYDYFKFSKGYGGHADNPAELITEVDAMNADSIIEELRVLVNQHVGAFIFVYRLGNLLQIGTGGYHMYDFDFELALKIEHILKRNDVQFSSGNSFKDAELIRLTNHTEVEHFRLSKKYFEVVGSSLKKYNAETSMIRFDCNVDVDQKEAFLNALFLLTVKASIDVVYYIESIVDTRHNLMLFFTNGRLGVAMQEKCHVDISILENGMDELIASFGIELKFVGGFENYPKSQAHVLKMVDEEFILGQ